MTAEKAPRKPFHEEFAEKIINHLEAGTAPWQKPWTPGDQSSMPPHNPASGTVYKGMNRVNLSFSGYDDPRWMTYRQAQDAGMQVAAGSKATPVVYYQWTKEEIKKDENDKPVLGEDGKPEKETVRLDRPILRFAHVFNGSQIEGMPPLPPLEPGQRYEWEPIEKAEAILSALARPFSMIRRTGPITRPCVMKSICRPKNSFPRPAITTARPCMSSITGPATVRVWIALAGRSVPNLTPVKNYERKSPPGWSARIRASPIIPNSMPLMSNPGSSL